ncbi:MAG TPA: thioredoxin-like domain-containing protein [Gemmataceae bacterium]|nr:thioredoxin-like domain-containing protein [Gemmataceae bacterium]
MVKARLATGLLASYLLACGVAPAWAAPTVAQMLGLRPKQQGVVYSTPTAQEEAQCKVEAAKWGNSGSGWMLKDSQGRPLRRFYNTRYTDPKDGTRMDVWSYYKDGVEVYREWASKNGDAPDQFRWLNAGGMKWGVDHNKDGKIDSWKMISAEEVSQELLQAVAARDYARLEALLISEAEIKMLDLPAAEAKRIRETRAQTATKFQAVCAKLTSIDAKTHWMHLETAAPQCLLGEQSGSSRDLIRHANATILYETNGKNDWLQTGEMIQVGYAWRLVDAPTPGAPVEVAGDSAPAQGATPVEDKEMQALLDQLKQLDDGSGAKASNGPDALRYNLARADLLEKVVGKAKADQRDPWVRQVADCLSTAAQNSPAGDKTAYTRLMKLEQEAAAAGPGSALAGYVVFREISADYATRISDPKAKFEEVQGWWIKKLTDFVQSYGKSEDAADALGQLGMVSELMGEETKAKNWYQMLARDFADKPAAQKAKGAIRRLECEGKPFELSAPLLETGANFDISQSKGKMVAVYYWASWNGQCVGDFAKLKLILDTYAKEGLELVCVSLDANKEDALSFLKRAAVPGTQLFKDGGMDGPMAAQYGIWVLPNLFLLDKEGKVASRTVQVATLEEELKKQLKK